jgi:hypothetical protein
MKKGKRSNNWVHWLNITIGDGGKTECDRTATCRTIRNGCGRRYTLTYIADDIAEIVACTTTVNVLQ